MANDSFKLIRIGNKGVKSALGFFWHDRHKIYVAATPEDIDTWKKRGYKDSMLHPMHELERTFRDSTSLRFISWCDVKRGCLVRQGARQVTFEYVDSKVVVHLK